MTATLPRTHIEMASTATPKRDAMMLRWHGYRRLMGVMVAVLGAVSWALLRWPAMLVVVVMGLGVAADASLAIKNRRSRTTPTIVADVVFTGTAIALAGVPGAAVGAVVAYFLLVIAVLGDAKRTWVVAVLAVGVGLTGSLVSHFIGLHDQPMEQSLIAGVVAVAAFGLSTLGLGREFVRLNRRGEQTSGRKVEVADAIAAASLALVARDDAGAIVKALDAMRDAMHTAVVFVERNVNDATRGLCAVVEERSTHAQHTHSSFDRASSVPWSVMPGARAHLEGGAPFFYRVEETRGTMHDRGGESGIQVEVDVPIIVNGAWVGVVGAADDDAERVWQTDDLILLRALADLVAAVWVRTEGSRIRESLIGSLDHSLSSRDQLISSVSHELRTPLTAVVGLSEELITAGESFGEEERNRLIEIIAESSKEMADLVEDLLVAARSEDGTLPVFPEQFALVSIAESVADHLAVSDGADVTIEGSEAEAFADPVRVRQIIRNLLTNAIRYGEAPIAIVATDAGNVARLDVHDSGRGIPDEDRAAIFEPYARAGSSRTVRSSVGIGLALSRRLARLMGGDLTYVDGDGSTFRLELPKQYQAPDTDADA